jgi:hypothetical protein
MTQYAGRKKRVTSDRETKTDRPHKAQHLQNMMPGCNIGNMTKGADPVIKNETPYSHDNGFDISEYGFGPCADYSIRFVGRVRPPSRKEHSAEPHLFHLSQLSEISNPA